MELATVIGLVMGVGACVVSVLAEGGHLGALVNPPAAIIVFGGTFGATTICFRLSDMISLPLVLKQAFFSTEHDAVKVIRKIVEMARLARSDGFLGLEKEVDEIAQTNPFLAKALQMWRTAPRRRRSPTCWRPSFTSSNSAITVPPTS